MYNNLKKIISYYYPYRKILFFDLIFSLVTSFVQVVIPFILRYMLNNFINFNYHELKIHLFIYSIIILFLIIIIFGCNYFVMYYGHIIAVKIEIDMKNELFKHYQKLQMNFFNDQNSGLLVSSITTDLENISEFMHHFPEELLIFLCKFLGSFFVLWYINKKLIWALIFIPIIVGYSFYFIPKIIDSFDKEYSKIANTNSILEENFAGIKIIKSFVNENNQFLKFKKANDDFFKSRKKTLKFMAWCYCGLYFLIQLSSPILIILGLFLILNSKLLIYDLMTLLMYESILISGIFSMLGIFEFMNKAIAGYNRFQKVLNIKPQFFSSNNAIKLKKIKGKIEFKNVIFDYSKDKVIFKNLDLKINPGEYIALVGSSGAGKSTLCSLIPRFYDILDGEILIDDIDVKSIELNNLRQNIGFVHQDTFLFSGTIKENICFGKIDAGDKEIVEAAKNAYAHDFIMKLPDGYNTQIGYRGLKLSGGQKQRLAITQVFLKNPPILIFDEATSNLDNESEKFIQKSMEKLSKNRTTIVIAHRLSTIRNAKRILVLSNGKIVEEGTHVELLSKNGIYHEFYNLL